MRYFPIEKDVSHLQILDGPVLAHTVILCLSYLSTFHDLDQYSSSWLLWTRIPTHILFPRLISQISHAVHRTELMVLVYMTIASNVEMSQMPYKL